MKIACPLSLQKQPGGGCFCPMPRLTTNSSRPCDSILIMLLPSVYLVCCSLVAGSGVKRHRVASPFEDNGVIYVTAEKRVKIEGVLATHKIIPHQTFKLTIDFSLMGE
jgi:hypothetical protein